MLDAFIIERIRREREQERRENDFVPLRIEPPPTPRDAPATREESPEERGSVVIDFSI